MDVLVDADEHDYAISWLAGYEILRSMTSMETIEHRLPQAMRPIWAWSNQTLWSHVRVRVRISNQEHSNVPTD